MAEKLRASERQLNLLGALLKARDGLLWQNIANVEGYNDKLPERSRQKRFERDLHDLRAQGLVVSRDLEDGARARYTLDRAACLMPALNLRPEQRLLMFQVGSAYLRDGEEGPLSSLLSSALLKLQAGAGREGLPAVVPPSLVRRSLRRRPAEAGVLQEIGAALVTRRHIKFRYEAPDGKTSTRTVAPWGMVSRRGGWYLVARDLDRGAPRTYRLSRIRAPLALAWPDRDAPEYDIPDGFDPEVVFSSEAFGAGENSFRNVQIRFDPQVAFIVRNEFEGIYRLDAHSDGGATLHLPQAYAGELLRYLCEFGGHWRILRPAELRQHVMAHLKGAISGKSGGVA
ncbi:MAG: WYL domain-containing protein [Planctomycetes bacterium]|nr:WYL domain-containing protein [Planctomycetota bacterium]